LTTHRKTWDPLLEELTEANNGIVMFRWEAGKQDLLHPIHDRGGNCLPNREVPEDGAPGDSQFPPVVRQIRE